VKTPTLLLVDVQQAIDDPSWGERNNPHAEANMARLLQAWRRADHPVVHVRHASREPHSTYRPDGPGYAFKPEVAPGAHESVLTKHVQNAFLGTDLESLLRASQAGPLVIAGVITNNSIEATARMAGNLGFDTIVVSDATFTFGKVDHDGVARSAQEVHALSLANLEGEYARVRTTQQVLQECVAV